MRGTFVMRDGEVVEKGGPKDIAPLVARSSLAFPMIISDEMPPAEHVDGNTYTSKRAFREVTRQHGLTEMGNEKQKPFVKPKPDRKGIRESLQRARAQLA